MKFLELNDNGIGTIKLPFIFRDKLSDPISNIMNISIEDTTNEAFFINLLKATIDAVKHVPDTERNYTEFDTTNGELCRLKILNRYITIDFYNDFKAIDLICSLSVPLNLRPFVKNLLDDYKELAESGLLKSFTKEDREYMRIINKYYQELYDLYKVTF